MSPSRHERRPTKLPRFRVYLAGPISGCNDEQRRHWRRWVREREPDTGIPTILRGVIDLVRRTGDVWQILGYRTDQIGATADADDELQARHRAQIEQYGRAWGQATGERVVSCGVLAVRGARAVQISR